MRILFHCLFLLCLVNLASGQSKDKPDLSGIWKLTSSKNIAVQDGYTETVEIIHTDPEVRFISETSTTDSKFETVYFSDERGEKNSERTGTETRETKTKWDGKTLVTRQVREISGPNNIKVKITITTRRELSKDDNSLKEITRITTSSPPGVRGRPVNAVTGNESPAIRVFSRVK